MALRLAAAGWFAALGAGVSVAAPPPSGTATAQALKIIGRIELPAGAARQGEATASSPPSPGAKATSTGPP